MTTNPVPVIRREGIMATLEEVARLRRMTGLDPDDEVYTTEVLMSYIDSVSGVLESAAAAVWSEKAAAAASLVDVTESGSSRRLSQLADQALKMRGAFGPADEEQPSKGRSFSVGIERV